jgi:hypothetical protein
MSTKHQALYLFSIYFTMKPSAACAPCCVCGELSDLFLNLQTPTKID